MLCRSRFTLRQTFIETEVETDDGPSVKIEPTPLDTNTITLHFWPLRRIDQAGGMVMTHAADGTVDVCFNNHADSGLSPTLPTDFIHKRRILSLPTDSSANIVSFFMSGREVTFNVPAQDVNVSNPGTSAALRSLPVPSGVKLPLRLWMNMNYSASGTAYLYAVTDPDTDVVDVASFLTAQLRASSPAGGVAQASTETVVISDTSGQVRTRASSSDVSVIRIITRGYIDEAL